MDRQASALDGVTFINETDTRQASSAADSFVNETVQLAPDVGPYNNSAILLLFLG
jgi:hypothetical protein